MIGITGGNATVRERASTLTNDTMAYFGENWDDADFPLAYLITIRTFGTWLHGDERFSVDTHGTYNVFGAPKRQENANLLRVMSKNLSGRPVILNKLQRATVRESIQEVCRNRGYIHYAISVRTNHAHTVVGGKVKPEIIANSFKSYATRKLRDAGLIDNKIKTWSRGRSRRYLWKPNHLDAAIDYVLYCQSDYPFEEWYSSKFED